MPGMGIAMTNISIKAQAKYVFPDGDGRTLIGKVQREYPARTHISDISPCSFFEQSFCVYMHLLSAGQARTSPYGRVSAKCGLGIGSEETVR